jgi:probable lipoprotein NlpC
MEDFIEEVVEKLKGIPYRHNGRSEEGVDCLGLVYLFFCNFGLELPIDDGNGFIADDWYLKEPERYINGLSKLGTEVGHFNNLQPFDIPYFRLYRNVITHSGVMIDEEHFINVLINDRVRVDTMRRRFWKAKYAGARRIGTNEIDKFKTLK